VTNRIPLVIKLGLDIMIMNMFEEDWINGIEIRERKTNIAARPPAVDDHIKDGRLKKSRNKRTRSTKNHSWPCEIFLWCVSHGTACL